MFYRKLSFGVLTLLFFSTLSGEAFAASSMNMNKSVSSSDLKDDDALQLYLSLSYQYSALGSVAIQNNPYIATPAFDNTTRDINSIAIGAEYKPSYNNSTKGARLAVGAYVFNDARAELEISIANGFQNSGLSQNNNRFGYKVNTNDATANMMFADESFDMAVLSLNGYYDFELNDKFVSYFGGGLGVARLNTYYNKGGKTEATVGANGTTVSLIKYPLAFNLGAGIKYSFNKNYPIHFGYKLTSISETLFGRKADAKILMDCAGYIKTENCTKKPFNADYLIHNFDIGITYMN